MENANVLIVFVSAILLFCIAFSRLITKAGIPVLVFFIFAGMIMGSEGAGGIYFDNASAASSIGNFALCYIIFAGGMATSWKSAREVLLPGALLSTAGVMITAILVGVAAHFLLGLTLMQGLLLGSVVSCTDAASVFSILRSKKLGLKFHTDSLLEVESGSNDPCAYMLTAVVLSLMEGGTSGGQIVRMILAQIAYGLLCGVGIAFAALWMLQRFKFSTDGFDAVFVLAVAVLSYALPSLIGGNGYLSAYLVGIILGNNPIKNKTSLVSFFDGVTGLMQIVIFFLLGLLSYPSRMHPFLLPALAIALFLSFAARPLAVFLLLTPLRCPIRQQLLVSWAGLRGASSIVFAIMATVGSAYTEEDLFHIVFCIVLLSVAFSGTLIPAVARLLRMIDNSGNVMKTFNDYSEETEVQLVQVEIDGDHPWLDRPVQELELPHDMLLVVLARGGEILIPNGQTVLRLGDTAVLSAPAYRGNLDLALTELTVKPGDSYCSKQISELRRRPNSLIVMVKRSGERIIPNGQTLLLAGDVLVICAA